MSAFIDDWNPLISDGTLYVRPIEGRVDSEEQWVNDLEVMDEEQHFEYFPLLYNQRPSSFFHNLSRLTQKDAFGQYIENRLYGQIFNTKSIRNS